MVPAQQLPSWHGATRSTPRHREKNEVHPVSGPTQEEREDAGRYWRARLLIEEVKAATWILFEYIHDFGSNWPL